MIEVLQATPAHVPVLAAIHARAVADPWGAEFMADLLAKPGVIAMLAQNRGKQPVAFILARRAGDEAEILMIATLPAARRQGAGKRLVVSLSKQLISQGVAALHLEVAEDNAPARALYAGLGFAEVGRRPGYYRRAGANVDAMLMRLNLVEAGARTK